MDFVKYQDVIRTMMSEARYIHCICVSEKAEELAQKYGADPQKAKLAGILHDITKEYTREQQLRIFDEFAILLNHVEQSSVKLWHAITGSAYVEHVLKIKDADILASIRYHTTARAGMSILEKVIFIADFISRDRDYEGVDQIRAAADHSLEEAMMQAMVFTIRDLVQKKSAIDSHTVAAYNEIILNDYGEKKDVAD